MSDKITADEITEEHAMEAWLEGHGEYDSEGHVFINGVAIPYWLGENEVWFYEDRNADGDDTIARFEVDYTFSRVE